MQSAKQKRIKILLLFYEPFVSGISRHVKYIVQTLPPEKFEFWLLCSGNDTQITDFFQTVIAENHIISVPPHRFFSLRGILKARNLIRKNDIHITHIHNLQSALWGYSSTIFTRCTKTIFTPHVNSISETPSRILLPLLLKLLQPFTTFFVAVSKSQQSCFKRWKIAEDSRIKLICNHIDKQKIKSLSHPQSDIRKELNILKDTVVITQTGRLNTQKDPFFLLRVGKILRTQCDNFLILFIGDGPLHDNLEAQIIKDNLTEHVKLLGYQKNIYQFFEATDIVTATSHWEGLPYSLIEAIYFKKPVVATDIPGHSDLIISRESGFLASNEQDFTDSLYKLINSGKLRAKIGKTCYAINKNLFYIQNMRASLSEIYTDF